MRASVVGFTAGEGGGARVSGVLDELLGAIREDIGGYPVAGLTSVPAQRWISVRR
jgi:hypothetical protein